MVAGGGGAGGLVYDSNYSVTAGVQVYGYSIGAGGGPSSNFFHKCISGNGSNSSFDNWTSTTASGGGGGGATINQTAGKSGGSGVVVVDEMRQMGQSAGGSTDATVKLWISYWCSWLWFCWW